MKGIDATMPKVTIYTSWLCPYCSGAKSLLAKKGVPFEEIEAPRGSPARDEAIAKSGGRQTVPQIFVGDVAVGGYDELKALDQAGKLDALLAA
jgi:glutaredoxin 3